MTSTYVGLDLGQANDYSALSVVQASGSGNAKRLDVVHLQRWPLHTPYPDVVASTVALVSAPPLKGSPLVIDRTGVGRSVYDLFKAEYWNTVGVSITSGQEVSVDPDDPKAYRVPKRDLVGVVQVGLQSRQLHIAAGLPDAATLTHELVQFRAVVTANAHQVFEAWRERDHDDLVLSLAVALWWERHGPKHVEILPELIAGFGVRGW